MNKQQVLEVLEQSIQSSKATLQKLETIKSTLIPTQSNSSSSSYVNSNMKKTFSMDKRGFSVFEIAETLNISTGTVKTYLSKMKKLYSNSNNSTARTRIPSNPVIKVNENMRSVSQMKRLGYSAEAIAKALNISRKTVHNYAYMMRNIVA